MIEKIVPFQVLMQPVDISVRHPEHLESDVQIFNAVLVFIFLDDFFAGPADEMFLYPALNASEVSSQGSGSWTMMYLRLPPSSALSCMTAWAVVAEPAKKSSEKIQKNATIFSNHAA